MGRYALLADPRVPDDLAEVHSGIEAPPTSLCSVCADGAAGKWWCPNRKNISDTPGAQNVTGTAAIAWSTCAAAGVRSVAEVPKSVFSIAWGSDAGDRFSQH